ncbi:hypothetical protein K1B37_000969 [Vibrio parahaemolyticus]|nr:hypothetical protein [Vibrio parahaemolyticus]
MNPNSPLSYYQLGAVTVTNGSNTVEGYKTEWKSSELESKPIIGSTFTVDQANFYTVMDIIDDVTITLDKEYLGSTTDKTSYLIINQLDIDLTEDDRVTADAIIKAAAASAQKAHNWAVGPSGTEPDAPSDSNNAMFFALSAKSDAEQVSSDKTAVGEAVEVVLSVEEALDTMTAEAESLDPDAPATADWDRENAVMKFGIPRGKPGYTNNKINDVGDAAASIDLDANQGAVFLITLSQAMTTINVNAVGTDPTAALQCILILEQGTGSNKVTWDSSIKWPTSTPPHISYEAGKQDTVALLSVDEGETWLAFLSASGF